VTSTSKARNLFIVAPTKPHIYESLKQAFLEQDEVEVILDRRRGERRRSMDSGARAPGAERRRGDRRAQTEAQAKLATMGCVFVPIEAPTLAVSPGTDYLKGPRHIP
jgi:hypothetical protein